MIGKLLDLPVDNIDDGTNVRSEIDTRLKASILEHGVIQPITVAPLEDDRYQCLLGHRRLAAARAAGLVNIPAIVQKLPDELPLRQLAENVHRRAVDPMDIARTLRTYLDEHPDSTRSELARKLGRSPAWVSTYLLLLDLDQDTQKRVSAGEITAAKAYDMTKAATPDTGRGRPRALAAARGGGREVVVELEAFRGPECQATISLDSTRRRVDVFLEDGAGYGVVVAITPEAAQLLAKRLLQAFEASAPRPAKVA